MAVGNPMLMEGLMGTSSINGGFSIAMFDYRRVPELVGGLEHLLFSHILGIIIPIDEYFSEALKPPTSEIS